jgi:rhamnosyltransferase
MKRVLFFVHYNKYNLLSDYIIYLLQHIRKIYNRIVFISNSPISDDNISKIKIFYDKIIIRENKGFDFGAWKDALFEEGWEKLVQYDNLTLMNDTCFGPLFDLKEIYIKMEEKNIDFWGCTISPKGKKNIFSFNRVLNEHIQSYFLCFNKMIISSAVFQNFWHNVKYQNNVLKVINLYETQLTFLLSKAGFKYDAIFSQNLNTLNIYDNNISNMNPDILIQNNIPFLKIKSFFDFSSPKYIIDLLRKNTNYPLNLIYDHVFELFNPNLTFNIYNRLINTSSLDNFTPIQKVAIYLHINNIYHLETLFLYLSKISFSFDLFITLETIDKELFFKKYSVNIKSEIKNICCLKNKNDDIFLVSELIDNLNEYDVVGCFHTFNKDIIYLNQYNNSLELLFSYSNNIIKYFNDNKKIGIIIPEISDLIQIFPNIFCSDKKTISLLNIIWENIKCKKEFNFKYHDTLFFPDEIMFWFRPVALKSLFINLSAQNNIFNKLNFNYDLFFHYINKLLIYISWNEGFDFRIITSNLSPTSNLSTIFEVNNSVKKVKLSNTFLVGSIILAIPKYFKRKLKSLNII